MQSAVLAGRLLLAAVFLAAGVGKLLDRDGSRAALADFGVPARLIAAAAVALPLAEVAIAIALVLALSARGGAVGAAAVLLAFTIAIGNAVLHHRAPECHCFGQIHSAPAGGGTLTRNGLLLLLAAFVASKGPGPALDTWVSQRTPGELALSASIAVLAILAAAGGYWLERRRRERDRGEGEEIRRRLGVPSGSPAPGFDLPGACGPALSLGSLRARGLPVMVLFADLDCCACEVLLPHVGRWQATLTDQLTIVLISSEDAAAGRVLCERYGIADVLLQSGFDVSNAYLTRGTPSAVIVGTDGMVVSDTATGFQMIHALVRVTLRRTLMLNKPQALSTQPT